MKKRHEKILAICAHNDDQILGAGGTLAKYAREGASFKTIIFSFGEFSHPHLRRDVIVRRRIKESLDSDKILGGGGVAYFGLKEQQFEREFAEKRIRQKLAWIIKKERPDKIFTHSIDDPHPDHQAVYKLILDILKDLPLETEVYAFDVWTVLNVRKRNLPKLVVDISDTYDVKWKAYEAHASQVHLPGMIPLAWKIHILDWMRGFNYKVKCAEVFYRLN